MKTIRVFAVEGRSLPFEGGVGRFVGRDKKYGAVKLDGDEVQASAYYQRAIARGDITLAAPEESAS
jgi:hypothetical protein